MIKGSFIKHIPLFASFKKKEREEIIRIAKEKTYPGGKTIFKEGEKGGALYIVVSGEVVIEKLPLTKATGSIITLTFKEGDFFGELSVFDEGPRSSSAKTSKDSTLIVLEREGFLRVLAENPLAASKFFEALIRIIAPRIRQMNNALMAFYEMGRLLSFSYEIDHLLDNILKIIMNATSAECGIILFKDNITDSFRPMAIKGYKKEELIEIDITKEGIARFVLEKGEPLLISDFFKETRFKEFTRLGYEKKTMLILPLRAKVDTMGLIILGDKVSPQKKESVFTANDMNLISAVIHQINATIENIQFHRDTEARVKLKRQYFKF
ncbi:cyclic nucleotide-binding domain-containing protein [Candidatus Omnitrophota bacterium]